MRLDDGISKHPDHVSDCCMACMQKRPLDGVHSEYAKMACACKVPYLDDIRDRLENSWYSSSLEVQEDVMRVEECARGTAAHHGLAGACIILHSQGRSSTN